MSSLHGRTSETIAVCVLLVLGVRGKRLLVVVVGFFSPRSKSETLLSSSFILAHRFFLVSLVTTVHHQSKCYSLLFYLSILCAHTSTERACQNATRFSDLPKGPLRVRNTSGFQHFRFRIPSTRYTDDYCLSKCNMLFHHAEMSSESLDASGSLWAFSG